jgi:titin
VERLEPRLPLTSFLVANTNDAGLGSLRQAILDANANPGLDQICFAIDSGPQTITPNSALPVITDPVVLDGTTQPGYAGMPLIELNGSQAGAGANGLRITAGDSTVQGLVINRFGQSGILIQGNGNDVLAGNFIGTDPTGTVGLGNGLGIDVTTGCNLIGGTAPGAGNVISGNRVDGMRLEGPGATGNVVQGNFIGTDVSGTMSLALPNSNNGVVVTGPGNTIGGTAPEARNVISGNVQQGIFLNGTGASGNLVQGNYIGTDVSGALAVSNGLRGITAANGASNNTVGGTDTGAGNLLSGNLQNGLELTGSGTTGNVMQGNLIGTDAAGTVAVPNHLRGVGISFGAFDNLIGGTDPGAGNLISGNLQNGVLLDANTDGNVVQGNFIGTDLTGSYAIPNQLEGVLIGKTGVAGPITNNLIGGTAPEAGNLISGNRGPGVRIKDVDTSGNLVQGNLIGTDATGTVPLPNGAQGVLLLQGANGNTVGGTDPGAGNVIAGNTQEGVMIKDDGTTGNVVQGNFVATDVTSTIALGNGRDGVSITNTASNNTIGGTGPGAGNVIAYSGQNGVLVDRGTGNAIQGNVIFASAGLGIRLTNNGNNAQPAPVLVGATSDGVSTTVEVLLTAAPDSTFTLEFFANTVCNPSGFGEGQSVLGSALVTTDDSGNADVPVTFATAVPPGEFLSATATDPGGNTSQFSACLVVSAPSPPPRVHSPRGASAARIDAAPFHLADNGGLFLAPVRAPNGLEQWSVGRDFSERRTADF